MTCIFTNSRHLNLCIETDRRKIKTTYCSVNLILNVLFNVALSYVEVIPAGNHFVFLCFVTSMNDVACLHGQRNYSTHDQFCQKCDLTLAGWCSGNGLDVYVGGACFESLPWLYPQWTLQPLSSVFPERYRNITRLRRLPSESPLIFHLAVTL